MSGDNKVNKNSLLIAIIIIFGIVFSSQLLFSMPTEQKQSPSLSKRDCYSKIFLPTVFNNYINYFDGPNEIDGQVVNNNTSLTADGPLRSRQNYNGTLNDQKDYFSIYVESVADVVTANFTGTQNLSPHNGVHLSLIYTGLHPQLTTNITNFAHDRDTTSPYEVTNSNFQSIGWYFVYIYAETPDRDVSYTLTVTYPQPATPVPITPPPTPTCPPPPGSGWEEVGVGSANGGGISNNDGSGAQQPAIALPLGAPEAPLIVWSDKNTVPSDDAEIFGKQWDENAATWQELGGSANGGGISNDDGGSSSPSIAIASGGTPYISWGNQGGTVPNVYVKHWHEGAWKEIDGSASEYGIIQDEEASNPAIAAAPNSNEAEVYVVWENVIQQEGSWMGEQEIYLKMTDGTEWHSVGNQSDRNGGISDSMDVASQHPSITVDADGVPYVAWEEVDNNGESNIFVRFLDSKNEWVDLGGYSATGISHTGNATYPDIASNNGQIFVAWQDDSTRTSEIYVKHWTGSAWEEVGINSASGGGISQSSINGGAGMLPSIAVSPDDKPYVAWQDDRNGISQIYVLRYAENSNGGSLVWQAVGGNSADDGGVSATSNESTEPDLVVSAEGAYVTWQDVDDGGLAQIYVRRWLP